MEDELENIIIKLPRDFPLDDLDDVTARLNDSGTIIPSYFLEEGLVLNLAKFIYNKYVSKRRIIAIPDRNIVSRVAKIAELGSPQVRDITTQLAIDFMAFCHCLDVVIEPAIAYHELAFVVGNQKAYEELKWFRSADWGQPNAWIDIAQGREATLTIPKTSPAIEHDLARPLKRWRRNYLVVLKIGELELSNLPPLNRVLSLLKWMIEDFSFAGPAAIFATMYFSPHAAKGGLIKQLRSADRLRAVLGIRNAAWDITYMSDFVERITKASNEDLHFLVTGDRALAEMLPLLICDRADANMQLHLEDHLCRWWPRKDAVAISKAIDASLTIARSRMPPQSQILSKDPVGEWIERAEQHILCWQAV